MSTPAWTDEGMASLWRVKDRLAPDEGVNAVDRFTHNITVAFDETVAELIREDRNGTALRAAGFTAAADAIAPR